MNTIPILSDKLDNLEDEMKKQTQTLWNIDANTKSIATVALADQDSRDRIYDRLAEGLLKMARVIGVGMILILVLSIVATFKQELHATFGSSAIDMGAAKSQSLKTP